MSLEKIDDLYTKFEFLKKSKLCIDISRGKPSSKQLDLSNNILKSINSNYVLDDVDLRNYGSIDGLSETKKMFASIFDCKKSEVIIEGSSSLSMMYNTIVHAFIKGFNNKRWDNNTKFLCPVPGYDRHFKICEYFGIEMISINMTEEGPDINQIQKYIKKDKSIKGIWCVPIHSNPCGTVYSDKVVKELASLKNTASDFRIFWDNAYIVHDLDSKLKKPKSILEYAKKIGNEDKIIMFASFSKITFPGMGISALASSKKNIKDLRSSLITRSIGSDKINQHRHLLFLNKGKSLSKHMELHRKIIKPKFKLVNSMFKKHELSNYATWTNPKGGYFISFTTKLPIAKRIEELLSELNIKITPAGACFPYGKNNEDNHLRIAPTFLEKADLKKALECIAISTKIAYYEENYKNKG